MDGVGHKVCGVLGGWIGEGGDVQLYAAPIPSEILAAVAAVLGAPCDHGIDVVDVALVVFRDLSAQVSFQVGVGLGQRDRHRDGVFFFLCTCSPVLQGHFHGSCSGFGGVEAPHEAVRRPCGRGVVPKAEGIKNSLDSDRVKAVAAVHLPVGRGHRRIQKRKGRAHLLDVVSELRRDFGGEFRSVEARLHRIVVVFRTAGANGA